VHVFFCILLPTTAGGESPDQLMQVMLPLIDNEVCNQPGWHNHKLDDSMVCAGFQQGEMGNCHVSFYLLCVCYAYNYGTSLSCLVQGVLTRLCTTSSSRLPYEAITSAVLLKALRSCLVPPGAIRHRLEAV